MSQGDRLNSEWVTLNAVREVMSLATKGDAQKSTYDRALEFGGEIYPEMLGPEVSLLRKSRESDLAKEYRQRAKLRTIQDGELVSALDLLQPDLAEMESLLDLSAKQKWPKNEVDKIANKAILLRTAKEELCPEAHTENQLIFRDAYNIARPLPTMKTGKGHRDFELPDKNVLRVRVLHPDRPEHVTGADLIYERHSPAEDQASIVAVQYKIWEERRLYINDSRLEQQISRLRTFTCAAGICKGKQEGLGYRFPYCSAFLRPTDRLQRPDQKLISTGQHLPICYINDCAEIGRAGGEYLSFSSIKGVALSGDVFEYLFDAGKIGSRPLCYDELVSLYSQYEVSVGRENVVIHAQELVC